MVDGGGGDGLRGVGCVAVLALSSSGSQASMGCLFGSMVADVWRYLSLNCLAVLDWAERGGGLDCLGSLVAR